MALWCAFLATGYAFDLAVSGMPSAPLFWLLYYGGAATVDLFMLRCVRFFVSSDLQRDIEAICIASIAVNALGWALKALAKIPPDLYNLVIAGLNYALALRLLLGDGNVLDRIDFSRWNSMVRSAFHGSKNYAGKEKNQ